MPTGHQRGFLAPDLAEVFPEMVMDVVQPAVLDSMGQVVHAAVPFKAVNTSGLTPILVAAFQEEHAVVEALSATQVAQTEELETLRNALEEQRARMDHLEQLLAACCANPDGQFLREGGSNSLPDLNDRDGDRKLRIQPNPFNESTTVYYTLERCGLAQLIANSADGKALRVLQEAGLEVGSYQYEWNTADFAAGVYYVTLLLDGQPVVKKAVKVSR